ncbi:Ig-like domain-containing protein [Psychrobacter phenylpyruvicus]|uniref:Ig-like domain-containing protein n=1 Tax=Psychrobacter phenylpyruvicus TaxID=29432 RepID=UPI00191BA250|nr:Ig-like domain-containing protein [Psychrobacter phenylpyruvicus]
MAEITDSAGNSSGPSETVAFTVDATVPGDTDNDGVADQAPVVTIPEAADGVNAEELSNGVETNVTIPTGTQEGDTVTLTITNPDGTTSTVEHTVDQAEIDAGTAAVTIPKDQIPADGDYSVVAEITDSAGNSSGPSETVAFTVDATVPDAPTVNPIETNDATPVITGTATVGEGETLTVTLGGATYTVTPDADGNWSVNTETATPISGTFTSLPVGTYDVKATVTDLAGNVTNDSSTNELTITPPSAVISSVTNADLLESGASQTAFTINLTPNTNSPTTAQFSIGAGTASSSDYSNFTFSNGVTFNSATGLLNIPKGVSSFTISTIPTEDRTTEGQETIVANIGGTSYTSTISDTSVSQASITVTGPDVTNFNGAQLPAVQEKDSTAAGVLTYTVTLDKAPEVDTIVKITLSGIATPGGQLGADYVVNGITNYTGYANNVVTVTIPKGQTQAVFHVDPLLEQSSQTFTAEPNESVIATINSSSNIAVSTTQGSATGVIIDSNPTAMRNITGDMSLLVGPVVGGLDNPLLNGASETVENGGLVTTNYDDQVFMGYYQNGVDSGGAGNISALLVAGGAGRITDGNSNITTIDLADGNDTLKIRDTQDALTRVYLGEGDDKYIVGNNLYSGYSFGESGNDIFNVTNTIGNGHQLYAGSGSDTITAGTINGLVDLGSGNTMPDAYLKTYNNSSLSLGNDSNVDLVTDVNTVTVRTGNISGTILGGEGIDNITVKLGNIDGGTLSLGSNNDSINILEGYIQGGSSIDMGDGNDTLVALGINNSSSINMGAGNDTVTLTATNNNGFGSGFGSATLDMGAGDDTVIFAGSSMDGTINGGVGNDTFNFTGSNQNLNGIKQFETINLGNKSNELNISFEDVLNANNKAVFINGGSTDTVDLGGNGTIPGGAGDQAGIRYIDNNALFNANDTFWVKGTSTQVGYDMYVYQGSSNAPNNEGYTVYIDTNIGTVI